MTAAKKKILILSDHPLVPSGVGTQARYLIQGLLATGKYSIICGGGAIKHQNYTPQMVDPEKYGEDWKIFPVDGYGDKTFMRKILLHEKPDAVVIFTDPRFFVWLWEMEDEVRQVCPILYWHVWDNDPIPDFNKTFYESTDHVACLSLKTYGLLQGLKNYDRYSYIPHAIAPEVFKPIPEAEVQAFKKANYGPHGDRKFVLFWNNRNARRKMTGDVIASFAKFLKKVGKDNAVLMMHTSPTDQEGQDIVALAKQFDIEKQLIISDRRIPPEEMNMFYNVADCTINIASNEGFGLSTLESLMSGTPIVAHMTGGLQFQLGDWWEGISDFSDQDKLTEIARSKKNIANWWGAPVYPAARNCTGSQQIPYIYDDRINHEDVVKALLKVYEMGRDKRKKLGAQASEWARKTFPMDKMISSWDALLQETLNNYTKASGPEIRLVSI